MKKAVQIFILSALLLTFMLTKTINAMQYKKEIWKDVVGYEGCYHISNNGDIRSVPRNGNKSHPIYLRKSGKFYDSVTLQKDGFIKRVLVHRLVAIAFIHNPDNKKFVNHINGNKRDNRVCNLEWCTISENEKHAHLTGLKNFKRENNPASKITSQVAKKIIREYSLGYGSQRFLAKKFKISQALINQIIKGKAWA